MSKKEELPTAPLSKIDRRRLRWLTAAELFDAWRTIPRLLVAGYGYLCWVIVQWYMDLTPSLLLDCDIELLGELCVVDAPTTQHAMLVTTVVGAAAVVFGLYTNGGRSWGKSKFMKWEETNMQRSHRYIETEYRHGNDRDFSDQDGDSFWDDVERSEEKPQRRRRHGPERTYRPEAGEVPPEEY